MHMRLTRYRVVHVVGAYLAWRYHFEVNAIADNRQVALHRVSALAEEALKAGFKDDEFYSMRAGRS